MGVVPLHGTVAFTDELHNGDGVWVRLSAASARQFCTSRPGSHEAALAPEAAWCLQYNQHLGKTLLHPVSAAHPDPCSPKTTQDHSGSDGSPRSHRQRESSASPSLSEHPRMGNDCGGVGAGVGAGVVTSAGVGAGAYTVVKCGASGHNIRSQPNLRAAPVGMLVLGNDVTADSHVDNNDGSWLRLDPDSTRRFCFTAGEAWSLAMSRAGVQYLQHCLADHSARHSDGGGGAALNSSVGFDFSRAPSSPLFRPIQQPTHSPFVFGGSADRGSGDGSSERLDEAAAAGAGEGSTMHVAGSGRLDLQGSGADRTASSASVRPPELQGVSVRPPELQGVSVRPPELQGVSVREMVKALGSADIRANGNGTPVGTPPRTPPATPRRVSRSSSPRAVGVGAPAGPSSPAPLLGSSPIQGRASSPVSIPGRARDGSSCSSSPLHVSPRPPLPPDARESPPPLPKRR